MTIRLLHISDVHFELAKTIAKVEKATYGKPRAKGEMLAELKAAALLDGVRGRAAVSREALIDVLLRIGGPDGLLMRLQHEIAEADLNPVIVSERGAMAVDARFILTPAGGAA